MAKTALQLAQDRSIKGGDQEDTSAYRDRSRAGRNPVQPVSQLSAVPTETVGVEIDTWLHLHPDGPAVFAAVGNLLDDPRQMPLAEAHVIELFKELVRTGEIVDVDPDEALDWLVEQRYARLVEG